MLRLANISRHLLLQDFRREHRVVDHATKSVATGSGGGGSSGAGGADAGAGAAGAITAAAAAAAPAAATINTSTERRAEALVLLVEACIVLLLHLPHLATKIAHGDHTLVKALFVKTYTQCFDGHFMTAIC
jgi:hypothetical protein